jgi:hypothetical protein
MKKSNCGAVMAECARNLSHQSLSAITLSEGGAGESAECC